MENNILGKTIKNARMKCGLSQRGLAELSGITQTQICRIETGKSKKLQLRTILSIGNILKNVLEVDFYDALKEVGFNEKEICTMYVKLTSSTSDSEDWLNISNLSSRDKILITKMYTTLSKLSEKDKSIIDLILD